ncbi:hypothetical protein ACFX2F_018981 [Malus domestica]
MILLTFHSFDLELVWNSEQGISEFLGFKSDSFWWVDLIVQSAFFSACFFCMAGRHEVEVSFSLPLSVPQADVLDEDEA